MNICRELRKENKADVGRLTVSGRLIQVGLLGRVNRKVPFFSKRNEKARLDLALKQ